MEKLNKTKNTLLAGSLALGSLFAIGTVSASSSLLSNSLSSSSIASIEAKCGAQSTTNANVTETKEKVKSCCSSGSAEGASCGDKKGKKGEGKACCAKPGEMSTPAANPTPAPKPESK